MLPIYLKILAIAILRHVGYTVLKEFTAVHRLLFCRVFSYRFSYRMQELSLIHIFTEQLKAENALEWVGRMNNTRACAMEIVNSEIIYA